MEIGAYRTPFYIKNDAGEYVEVGSIEIPLKVTVNAVGKN